MRYSSPLVSTMTTVNSSSALNMKNVSCTNIMNNQFAMSAIATILVIGDTHTGMISSAYFHTDECIKARTGHTPYKIMLHCV